MTQKDLPKAHDLFEMAQKHVTSFFMPPKKKMFQIILFHRASINKIIKSTTYFM